MPARHRHSAPRREAPEHSGSHHCCAARSAHHRSCGRPNGAFFLFPSPGEAGPQHRRSCLPWSWRTSTRMRCQPDRCHNPHKGQSFVPKDHAPACGRILFADCVARVYLTVKRLCMLMGATSHADDQRADDLSKPRPDNAPYTPGRDAPRSDRTPPMPPRRCQFDTRHTQPPQPRDQVRFHRVGQHRGQQMEERRADVPAQDARSSSLLPIIFTPSTSALGTLPVVQEHLRRCTHAAHAASSSITRMTPRTPC